MSFDKAIKEGRNVMLAKTIQRFDLIYDQHHPLYTNRVEQEKAWKSVARLMDEPVSNVKENWRSLRNSFVRDLRLPPGSNCTPNGKRKTYYMSEHLQFLVPFLPSKQRQNHAARWMATSSGGHVATDDASNSGYELFSSDLENSKEPNHGPPHPDEDAERAESTYSSNNAYNPDESYDEQEMSPVYKRLKITDEGPCQPVAAVSFHGRTGGSTANQIDSRNFLDFDPDFDFLRSLLPDFKKLSGRQKMTFKLQTLQFLNDNLYSEELHTIVPSKPTNNTASINFKQENFGVLG